MASVKKKKAMKLVKTTKKMANKPLWPTTTKVLTKTSSSLGLEHGFKSGLEDINAELLMKLGQKVSYESHKIEYTQPGKLRRYTPDFILENGIIIETKGRFVTADRQKHLMIKECHPDLDIRFVFSRPSERISKQSKTTYAAWCDHKGFMYAHKYIPLAWINEPTLKGRILNTHKATGWKPYRYDPK